MLVVGRKGGQRWVTLSGNAGVVRASGDMEGLNGGEGSGGVFLRY